MWLTDIGAVIQTATPNKIMTLTNQIFYFDGNAYLIPRGLITDNYTMPLGIDKSKRDARPSHLHDIGCKYHQFIIIDLPLHVIMEKYIIKDKDRVYCKDIPIEYLKLIPTKFNNCNNILYYAMLDCNIPKGICKLYRTGVNFNVNWLFTGRDNINLDNLYKAPLKT